jgi:predicted metal-binding membrane protein
MDTTQGYPLPRERNLILAGLLVLTVVAWIVLFWGASWPDMAMGGLTMGLSGPLFVTMWVVMTVAMMFPSAAPMILTFAQISAGKRRRGQAYVPTWIFVGAYLLVWALSGVVAYGAALLVTQAVEQSAWLMDHTSRIGGLLLLLAGVYQLTPLKRACLTKCRTPRQFIMTSWRDGHGGAFHMGVEHGLFCLGCCWLLSVILFPLGVMNIAAMAAVTLVIFAEKTLPGGFLTSRSTGGALIVIGLFMLVAPAMLPTLPMAGSSHGHGH